MSTTPAQKNLSQIAGLQTLEGSCHCGAVRFRVKLDLAQGGTRCNCSICRRTNVTSSRVKPDAFAVLQGEDQLTTYTVGDSPAGRCFRPRGSC